MRKLHDKHYARGDRQYEQMLEQLGNECGFCTMKVHTKPILKRIGFWLWRWFVTERIKPYENAELSFLIIPKRHLEHVAQIGWLDWLAVRALVKWVCWKNKIKGYGLVIRSGATEYTGATVVHIHFHLIVTKLDEATGRAIPVYFPIG